MEKSVETVGSVQPQSNNIRSSVESNGRLAAAGRVAAVAVGFVWQGLFNSSGLKIQVEPGVTREVHNQSDDLVRIQTKRYLM